jgi:hypothetical protein
MRGYCCCTGLFSVRLHIRNELLNSKIIHTFTYLVLEIELIPIPLFKELFIDSTGDVVIASNYIEILIGYKMLNSILSL